MYRTTADLERLIDHLQSAPREEGLVEMVVRRPDIDLREVVETGVLDPVVGLVGDNWEARGAPNTADGSADPLAQLTIMNSRVAHAVALLEERWPLCGDQIYVDMDISHVNLPAGSRLQIGTAIVEVSPTPHTGCQKFASRFGAEALRFVNVGVGREGRFRGLNAFVVEGGWFRKGDRVRKLTGG